MQPPTRDDPYKYLVDLRWTFGLGKKYFFVFSLGRDRRSRQVGTNIDRRKRNHLGQALVFSGILSWIFICVMIVTALVLYVMKSRMGIDLVSEGHPIPDMLKSFGICH